MTGDAFERQRAFMLALLFGAFAALALFANLPAGLFSKDLAHGKPWRTSSTYVTCAPKLHSCSGMPLDIFFHTNEEESPWLEIDLGTPRSISSLRVRNRRDCCPGRAVPLIAELSDTNDAGAAWREVARRDEPFDVWEPSLQPAQTGRYVRLRVAKKSLFHLEGVEVYP